MHRKVIMVIYTILALCIFTACVKPVHSPGNRTPFITVTAPTITPHITNMQTAVPTLTQTPTAVPTPVVTQTPIPTASELDYEELNKLSSTSTGWGFYKDTRQMVEKYGGFCIKDTGNKHIYLTYNLGYEYGFTNKLLDMLKEKNVKASFFPIGSYVRENVNTIKRIVNEGHLLGSHGETHINNLPSKTPEYIVNDLKKMQNSYKNIFGEDFNINYYRPPYGIYSERLLYIARQMGLTSVFWSYTYTDWEANKPQGKDNVYKLYMDNLKDGMILQLHVSTMDNISVLEDFVDEARRLGYEFYRVDEMK